MAKNDKNFGKYHKKFIADKKIISVKLSDRKTYNGKDVYLIKYRDDTSEELPAEIVEKFALDSSTDLNTFVFRRIEPIVLDIIKILLEAEIRIEWIQHIVSKLNQTVQWQVDRANGKLWGKDPHHLNLADLDKVLKDDEKEKK